LPGKPVTKGLVGALRSVADPSPILVSFNNTAAVAKRHGGGLFFRGMSARPAGLRGAFVPRLRRDYFLWALWQVPHDSVSLANSAATPA
jgi:hypothetical protein